MKKLLFVLSIVTCLVGCSSPGDNEDNVEQNENISFTSLINPLTKATSSNFENGDAISVFGVEETASRTDGKLYGSNYVDNSKYIFSGSVFSSLTPITYPTNGNKLFFHAVYPYQSSIASTFTFKVNNDQSVSNNYTQSDLMTASTAATSVLTPALQFSHRLSNIIVNLTFEQAPTGTVSLVFSKVAGSVSADLNTNIYAGTGGADATVTAAPNGTNSYRAILPPQTIISGTQFIVITAGEKQYKIVPSENIVWKSGLQYQYNVDIKNDKVTFTSAINPWGDPGTIDDVVPPTIQEKMKPYITVHGGKTPPNITGVFYIDPMVTVFCEDYETGGGFAPGRVINSSYIQFSNQDNSKLSIKYEEKQGNNASTATGAFISGSNNDFTVYLNTEGVSNDIATKTALVISGTKTDAGISGLRYAFVMVEKGADPDSTLMNVGVFRVFEDKDGLSVNSTWPATKAFVSTNSDLYQSNCMSNALRRKY